MTIAETIKQNNIVEYILFIWQAEDMVRAFHLDTEKINSNIIKDFNGEKADLLSLQTWYQNLIKKLKLQGKKEKGHLNEINEVINELNYLHATLINLMQDPIYTDLYKEALPYINDFRGKSDSPNESDIHLCLNALYGKLILKLKGADISEETEKAFKHFRNVLAHLSVKYKDMKAGTLTIKNGNSQT